MNCKHHYQKNRDKPQLHHFLSQKVLGIHAHYTEQLWWIQVKAEAGLPGIMMVN